MRSITLQFQLKWRTTLFKTPKGSTRVVQKGHTDFVHTRYRKPQKNGMVEWGRKSVLQMFRKRRISSGKMYKTRSLATPEQTSSEGARELQGAPRFFKLPYVASVLCRVSSRQKYNRNQIWKWKMKRPRDS